MTSITLDTLKLAETLRESGFDEKQSRGLANAMRQVQESNLEELATKRDIADLRRDIDSQFNSMFKFFET